jgi:hypothetical protein
MPSVSTTQRILRCCCAILMTCLAFGALPSPSHAAGMSVTKFYTTTKAAADAWSASSSAPAPVHVANFPAGTVNVAYYFEFSGAKPGVSTFQVVQHGPGNDVVKGDVHTLHHVDGSYSNYFYNDPAFGPGTYTLNLQVGKQTIATTSFTIKPGIVIPAFFTITNAAFEAWKKSTSDAAPKRTLAFPAGTTDVAYYFSFAGVTPKVTTFRVDIYNDGTGALFLKGDVHTLHHVSGYFANDFFDHPSFPGGAYRMVIVFNGVIRKTTHFTIGG